MSVYKVSNTKLMIFVELYHGTECLWNVNLAMYGHMDQYGGGKKTNTL